MDLKLKKDNFTEDELEFLDTPIYVLCNSDIRTEALSQIGTELSEEEYDLASELLSYGIGENLNFLYSTIIEEIKNKRKEKINYENK